MISSLHLYHLYIRQHCSAKKNRACQGCANVCEIILIKQQMVAHIVFSLCWFPPHPSSLLVSLPPLFPYVRALKFGIRPSFFSLYTCHPLSWCQLTFLCRWFLEAYLYFCLFQSFRLKSPITCWALPPYSKLSMYKVTYTASSLEFLLHCLPIHSNLFIEAFYSQGSVQGIGNTIVSKNRFN